MPADCNSIEDDFHRVRALCRFLKSICVDEVVGGSIARLDFVNLITFYARGKIIDIQFFVVIFCGAHIIYAAED